MLCERCKKNTAIVHLIRVVNGEKSQMCLCEKCMKEITENPLYLFNMDKNGEQFRNIIDEIFQSNSKKLDMKIELVCKNCGTKFSEFKETGLLGCPDCYENFSELLKPVLKESQEDIIHKGKTPQIINDETSEENELDTLEINLRKAINEEEYELAAIFRDKINKIKKGDGYGKLDKI